ncbi:MAG TPA: YfiR family protein [Casimicrobiaceae bacterium]|jgi:hypothetical protein
MRFPVQRIDAMRALAAGLMAFAWTLGFGQDRSLEYAVKATYLYKFAPFVQWPDDAFESPASPLTLCVLGSDPLSALIDEAVGAQVVDGRPVAVRHLMPPLRETACHMLYVASSRAATLRQALETVRGRPVLTIADEAPPGEDGLVVNLVTIDGRVRFEIDLRAAAANRLVVSSKLLALALSVRHNP